MRRLGTRLGARRRAYRRGQSVVLLLLATLVVLACASGPWYERAVEQATVRSTLAGADRPTRSLSIGVDANTDTGTVAPRGAAKRLFDAPIAGTDVFAGFAAKGLGTLSTTISSRTHVCKHLSLVAGRCATNSLEVVGSAPLLAKLHLGLQSHLTVQVPGPQSVDRFPLRLRIVGSYRPFASDNDYWFGTHYSSPRGIVVSSDAVQADSFFGSDSFVAETAARVTGALTPRYYVNAALQPDRVGIDDLPVLRRTIDRLSAGHSPVVDVQGGLAGYLDQIETGRSEARRIVLAISVQLALLALIAFGVVVAAAAEQRRPELALARLRGRSPARSTAVFLREIGGLTVLALVPGVLAAYGLVAAACHFWLVPGVRPEWRWPILAATVGALVVALTVVGVIGLRTSRLPITDLLRQVPKRVSRAGVGTAEAMVAVAALAGLIASIGNGSDDALATLTPTFLAVLVGLILSRLVSAGGRLTGQRALWRGGMSRALAGLGIARRTGARFTITVLCVATAVVVFAAQQWSVAASNREQRAAAVTGAPVVLDVSAPSAPTLVAAVRDADPHGDYASPVIVVVPPGTAATPTVAVEPASFARIASWGRSTLRPSAATLARVRPRDPAPAIFFRATSVQATLADVNYSLISHTRGNPAARITVRLELAHRDGRPAYVDLGPLPEQSTGPVTLRGTTECADGCRVRGLSIQRPVLDADPVDLHFTVASLRAGGTALRIGTAKQWATVTDPVSLVDGGHTSMSARDAATGLEFNAIDDGDASAMQHLDVPVGLPALLAGRRPNNTDTLGYQITGSLEGGVTRVVVQGRLPFVPQIGGRAIVVDLGLAIRTSEFLDATAHPSVWLARDDPAREKAFVAALQRHGVVVAQRHSEAVALSQLAHSAPGWSTQLTLAVAVISELLAIALLVLVVVTSRRTRQQDIAALRLIGLSRRRLRRATVLELLTFVVIGVAGGTVAGLVAVRLSLPSIPIFTAAPSVPIGTVFPIEWTWLVGALLLSVILLVGTTLALGRGLVRRAPAARPAGDGL